MENAIETLSHLNVSSEFKRPLADLLLPWKFKTHVDILVVVDTGIAIEPVADGFGISTVIQHIRNSKVGCMHFHVDVAIRNGEAPSVVASPGQYGAKYRGFRFNMTDGGTPVIDKYEQIWCFGFAPGNSGNTSDAPIDQPSAFPASNAELAKLSSWMNERKGGLFGTGDHHFLGASMCHRIPRLGSMRRWTNADGVPPQFTPARIDTLRPPSAAYEPGAPGGPLDLSNGVHQADLKPQPINWVAWQRSFWPVFWKKRPHPVLCHPTLGPINVMPDHAHEGLCVDTGSVPLNGTFDFDGGGAKAEYPDAIGGGDKPEPQVIAYGSTLGDPPYNFLKGPQPARASFPMISAYDGHKAGVGRVATDSTWHHWMDTNIDALKAANNDDWKKIGRYFVNLAVWLNPPGFTTHCLYVSAVESHFQYPGFQEYHPRQPVSELGEALRIHLGRIYGPCWVTERIWDLIEIYRKWPPRIDDLRPPVEFGGIDPVIFENTVLGAFVRSTMEAADAVKEAARDGRKNVEFRLPPPEEILIGNGMASLDKLMEQIAQHHERSAKLFSSRTTKR